MKLKVQETLFIAGIIIIISLMMGFTLLYMPLIDTFILAFLIVTFFCAAKNPQVLLWILIFGSVANLNQWFSLAHINIGTISFYAIDILLLSLCVFSIFSVIIKNREKFFFTRCDIPLMIFFILGCIALLRGIYPYGKHAFNQFRPIFGSVIFFATLSTVENLEQIQKIIKVFFIATLFVMAYGFFHLITKAPVMISGVGTPRYFAGSQTLFLAFSLIFIISLFLFEEINRYRTLLFAISIMQLLGIALGFFRATWLGLLAACLFMIMIVTKKYKDRIVVWLVVGLVTIVIILATLSLFSQFSLINAIVKNVQSIYEYRSNFNAVWRLNAWTYAMGVIKKSPIFGNGFTEAFYLYDPSSLHYEETDPHNSYLWLTMKMGIVGLIVFCVIVGIFFKEGITFFRKTDKPILKAYMLGFLASYVCMLVFTSFGCIFINSYLAIFIWIIPAMGMSLIKIGKNTPI